MTMHFPPDQINAWKAEIFALEAEVFRDGNLHRSGPPDPRLTRLAELKRIVGAAELRLKPLPTTEEQAVIDELLGSLDEGDAE